MKNPYEIKFTLHSFVVRDPSKPEGETYHNGVPLRSAEDTYHHACAAVYNGLDADKEHFVLFALNNKNRFVGFKVISTGSLTASLVHPREVYRAAIFLDAAAVIFCHNHPSGDPAPSPEDIEITRRLKECGELFGIKILDHVILGEERFFSFSERGLL